MDIHSLECFLELAASLHFGKTSQKYHKSASTLSRLIQRLEDEAGVKLFERNNRYVKLTPDGERYRQFAAETTANWAAFQRACRQQRIQLSGDVNLYCSVTASHSLLRPILANLRQHQPGIDIKLHTGDQATSLERLEEGRDDFVIAVRPEKLSSRVVFKRLATTAQVFIAPRQSCAVREKLQQLGGLAQLGRRMDGTHQEALPWIVAAKGMTRLHIEQWWRQHKVKADIYAEVTGHEAIVSMVALGCGIGIVPELVLENSPLRDSIEQLNSGMGSDVYLEGPLLAEGEVPPDLDIGLCVLKSRLSESIITAVWETV